MSVLNRHWASASLFGPRRKVRLQVGNRQPWLIDLICVSLDSLIVDMSKKLFHYGVALIFGVSLYVAWFATQVPVPVGVGAR
jgi:hypothetical protein